MVCGSLTLKVQRVGGLAHVGAVISQLVEKATPLMRICATCYGQEGRCDWLQEDNLHSPSEHGNLRLAIQHVPEFRKLSRNMSNADPQIRFVLTCISGLSAGRDRVSSQKRTRISVGWFMTRRKQTIKVSLQD
jgi:hypothetical protein